MYRADLVKELIDDVWTEVGRQEALWGVQEHPDGTGDLTYLRQEKRAKNKCNVAVEEDKLTYAMILEEEAFEALAAKPNSAELVEELTQLAAVCLSWIRTIQTRQ